MKNSRNTGSSRFSRVVRGLAGTLLLERGQTWMPSVLAHGPGRTGQPNKSAYATLKARRGRSPQPTDPAIGRGERKRTERQPKVSSRRFLTLAACVGSAVGLYAPLVAAATFDPLPLAPELDVDRLDRTLTQTRLDRTLLENAYATVAFGTVDLYEVFPYVEAHYVVVVSDPGWNRIVATETGSGQMASFDGQGTPVGALAGPRGMAVDASGRLYLCDTDNDRVLVLDVEVDTDGVRLIPRESLDGIKRPFDVAHSDAGTVFDPSDDRLFVVESGRNRVVRFDRAEGGFTRKAELGGLGNGRGRFAGPLAITVGRSEDGNTTDVYVADSHSRRIVRLQETAEGLAWVGSTDVEDQLVTGLDTDRWGNVYSTAPLDGCVCKRTPDLIPLATLRSEHAPRDFHVPFVITTDHRHGERRWTGKNRGLMLEEWGPESGLRLWSLGLEVRDAALSEAGRAVQFTLTDPADVTVRAIDPVSGAVLATVEAGRLTAGDREVSLTDAFADGSTLEIEARSAYADGDVERARVGEAPRVTTGSFAADPNPFRDATRFWFANPSRTDVAIDIFDPAGRRVRTVRGNPSDRPLSWDGKDDAGHDLGSGVYLYRLGGTESGGKLVKVQ